VLFFYVPVRLRLRTPIFAYLMFTHYLFLLLSVLGHRRWYFVLTWSVHYDLINNITYLYPCRHCSVPPCSVVLPRTEVRIGTRHLIPVTLRFYLSVNNNIRCTDHFVSTPENNDHTHFEFYTVPCYTYLNFEHQTRSKY